MTDTTNSFLFIVCMVLCSSKTKATTLNCSNAPPVVDSWPEAEALGFGNTPTSQPLKKVVAGRKQFEEIIKRHNTIGTDQSQLVGELLDLLKQKTKYCCEYNFYN